MGYNEVMNKVDQETLKKLCHYGAFAPSVHNIQPWQFTLTEDTLIVEPSSKRILNAGDPVGRQTWISIGACVESIVVAGENLGLSTDVRLSKDKATLHFKHQDINPLIELQTIKERFTDRSHYTGEKLNKNVLSEISKCWQHSEAAVIVTDDPQIIETVSKLISQGISMALNSPHFREELAGLINGPREKRKIGIPVASLRLKGFHAVTEVSRVRKGLGIKKQALSERKAWSSASAIVFTLSKGDSQKDWFMAGRAYQRAGLTATRLGLRQATSAAIVEALDFHEDVEKLLGTRQRLQTVMRIGKSAQVPVYSPRLSNEDLLNTR